MLSIVVNDIPLICNRSETTHQSSNALPISRLSEKVFPRVVLHSFLSHLLPRPRS